MCIRDRLGDVHISGSTEEALATPCDVFVDYTSATAVKANVLQAIAAGHHVVIGSSGLSDDDFAEIDRAAREKRAGVVAVGNFAISAGLLVRFAKETARHMPSWEIIDYAHESKVDAPSGTRSASSPAWCGDWIRFCSALEDRQSCLSGQAGLPVLQL